MFRMIVPDAFMILLLRQGNLWLNPRQEPPQLYVSFISTGVQKTIVSMRLLEVRARNHGFGELAWVCGDSVATAREQNRGTTKSSQA